MPNQIVSVHAGIYAIGIYAIMLPFGGFSVAHCLPHCIIGESEHTTEINRGQFHKDS